jgi:hypothetical protein
MIVLTRDKRTIGAAREVGETLREDYLLLAPLYSENVGHLSKLLKIRLINNSSYNLMPQKGCGWLPDKLCRHMSGTRRRTASDWCNRLIADHSADFS